ncbi:MAG: hypothetical protein IK066_04415 [Kiritimatiellae bacterium]|nr:hypothetical protein [Kiritimatiellia bacterium]
MKRLPPLLASLALLAASALASESRYREFVVGERAAGMGGAALAIGRDVDAIYANPAGLAFSERDSISLSANLYGLESSRLRNGLAPGDDASSSTFVSVPSAMGGVARLSPDWVAGFGVFTPKEEQGRVILSRGGNARFYNLSVSDQTMWIGPAIAWRPAASRLSLGAALFGVYREISQSQSRYIANEYNYNFAAELKTLGLLASLGARCDLGAGWFLGANLHSPNLRVYDEGKISANLFGRNSGEEGSIYSSDVDADNRTPWQLALGVGRESPGRWAFALDGIYHPSASYSLASWNLNGYEYEQTLHLHSVLDVSLGGEVVVAENYPVRAGVYTAFSASRVPSDPGTTDIATSDVDMYGVTFSVGRRKDHVSVNIGIDYAFGHGHDLGYSSDNKQVRTPCREEVFLCSVSTVYHF